MLEIGVTVTNQLDTTNIVGAGIITASSLDISGGVDVDGHTDLDNVSISGVTTFTGATNSFWWCDSKHTSRCYWTYDSR